MAGDEHDAASRNSGSIPSRNARRAGWTLSGIVILLLAFDSITKIFPNQQTIDGTVRMGYQLHQIPIIGLIGLGCLVLYVIPRTAPLGAILYTGYMGGAVASNLRMELPLFTFILAPVYVSAFIWGGLYLRDARVRALVRASQ